jgi:hypothetical protein
MSRVRNWRWEKFAQEVAGGGDPREAYALAGYKPDRDNHNRLLRRSDVACRIEELKLDRLEAARSARMSPAAVIAALSGCGIARQEEFFERDEVDEVGGLRVRDHHAVPVEASIALLRFLRESLGILLSEIESRSGFTNR